MGEAPKVGLQKAGWGSGVQPAGRWGVLSSERSPEPGPRPGVGGSARAGVVPFCRGVLGGRFLSKNSGVRGPPKRTCFLFFFRVEFASDGTTAGRDAYQCSSHTPSGIEERLGRTLKRHSFTKAGFGKMVKTLFSSVFKDCFDKLQ